MSRETRSSRATSTTTDVSRNARGARAIDSDESCIERLYRTAKDGRRSITALIADVLCPTPALCLGLMHHLHVNGRQSFERIAAMLDELSTRQVVVEFVARDDPNVALLNSARAADYDLAQVRAALGRHFSTIEDLPSDRPTRTILLCGK